MTDSIKIRFVAEVEVPAEVARNLIETQEGRDMVVKYVDLGPWSYTVEAKGQWMRETDGGGCEAP